MLKFPRIFVPSPFHCWVQCCVLFLWPTAFISSWFVFSFAVSLFLSGFLSVCSNASSWLTANKIKEGPCCHVKQPLVSSSLPAFTSFHLLLAHTSAFWFSHHVPYSPFLLFMLSTTRSLLSCLVLLMWNEHLLKKNICTTWKKVSYMSISAPITTLARVSRNHYRKLRQIILPGTPLGIRFP